MKIIEGQCYPGQVCALNLKRGSILVAKDGALRVEYRDESLDWLLDATPHFSVKLMEGAQHILQCNAFVMILTDGTQAVNYVLMPPGHWRRISWRRWTRLASWSGWPQMPNRRNGH